MFDLIQQRQQATQLYLQHADKFTPTLIDYQLDSFLRDRLGLPELPQGNLPYVGWMVGASQPSNQLKISARGVAFIKRWEGLRLNAYQCSASVWTIGYGHTKAVKPGDRITRRQAEKYFLEDIPIYEEAVKRHIKVELNQNQFDALVSFVYNVGEQQFKNSTLVRLLNQGLYEDAAQQLLRWNRAGGQAILGLTRRRKEELKLFKQ